MVRNTNARAKARRARRLTAITQVGLAVALAGTAFFIAWAAGGVPPRKTAATRATATLATPTRVLPKTTISYADARPILETLRARLPAPLASRSPADIESAWPAWVASHDAAIRARLERGDEDSLVNLWMYGTTFTSLPRVVAHGASTSSARADTEGLMLRRLDNLVAGLTSPGSNERLQFAREVLEHHGIDPSTSAGQDQARLFLAAAQSRMVADNTRYRQAVQSAGHLKTAGAALSAYATLYSDRGLSSDTSINADFALEQTIAAMKAAGRISPGGITRVAIVGPGLDFTDKAEGYDFYPQQTIQPFALVDSLIRYGLATSAHLQMTTLDLSPRVNQHLENARRRAADGAAYVLQLPLDRDSAERQWQQDLVRYWQRMGDQVGDEGEALAAPPGAGGVRVRTVRVRPAVVQSITAQDVNIVVERLDTLAADQQFDLIVATNILVYYDAFDQALALNNISHMLRPGGFFLTNYEMSPAAPMEPAASLVTSVDFDRAHDGDTLFWYQKH